MSEGPVKSPHETAAIEAHAKDALRKYREQRDFSRVALTADPNAPFATLKENGLATLERELRAEPWSSRGLAVLTLIAEVRYLREHAGERYLREHGGVVTGLLSTSSLLAELRNRGADELIRAMDAPVTASASPPDAPVTASASPPDVQGARMALRHAASRYEKDRMSSGASLASWSTSAVNALCDTAVAYADTLRTRHEELERFLHRDSESKLCVGCSLIEPTESLEFCGLCRSGLGQLLAYPDLKIRDFCSYSSGQSCYRTPRFPDGRAWYMAQVGAEGSVFIKELSFFHEQGGFRQKWGTYWVPVIGTSIENARENACKLPNARPYSQQAKP